MRVRPARGLPTRWQGGRWKVWDYFILIRPRFPVLGPVGVGADPGHIREYTFDIPDYGRTKYDAECIDLAREEADRDWAKVRETAEEMARLNPDFPQDMDDSWRYNLIADNCQDYVADVLKRAEAIARKKRVPLIVE